MRLIKFCIALVFFLWITPGVKALEPINKDRWVEIDLFWFELDKMKESSDRFWQTMAPLFEDISGEKGVIINIGWLMDFILEWDGNLNSRINLPKNMTIENQFSDEGFLLGSTQERMAQWTDRFARARATEVVEYEPWTYKDLRDFIVIFKKSAERKGVKNLKVGTFVLGWTSIYRGNVSTFLDRHKPETYPGRAVRFNPTHILSADNKHFGAYPAGIPAGLPITQFFGNQWGDFSKKVGFDAIVLRDSSLGHGIYLREGPFGRKASADQTEIQKWTDATAALVRFTKQANPKALVIGYSNGATAVADWRVNCMDIEKIAQEGYLDAYIDQSWAGAWNEVGQRRGNFWNFPYQGWTQHLSYILLHAAMLSETPAKHYFLTETFDGWESWNIINTARERLRWGIWAYSHAGVVMQKGYKFPDGSYISWANQAKRLLDADQVDFLKTETNNAFRDIENIEKINGPTLVYSRSAMEWQMSNQPDKFIKEWIDDQAGILMKWNVPIMTAARMENLGEIESDLFIIQTPVNLKDSELASVNRLIDSGRPVVVVGSPVGGIDQSLLSRTGLSATASTEPAAEWRGSLNGVTNEITKDCPNSFLVYQYFTRNRLERGGDVKTYYSVAGSPALIQKERLIIWDAPDQLTNFPDGRASRAMVIDETIGSPTPYVVLARLITRELAHDNAFHSTFDEINNPVWCGSWVNKAGNLMILTGELEEGFDHSDKGYSSFNMIFPQTFDSRCIVKDLWQGNQYVTLKNHLRYVLRKGESKLFKVEKL